MGKDEDIMMARRIRPSRDEHAAWCASLVAIVEEIQPATVRQVFYQATVRGLIEKTELGYDKVQRVLSPCAGRARCRGNGSPTTPARRASR